MMDWAPRLDGGLRFSAVEVRADIGKEKEVESPQLSRDVNPANNITK